MMVDGNNILPMATSQDHKARDNRTKGQIQVEWELILQHQL